MSSCFAIGLIKELVIYYKIEIVGIFEFFKQYSS